MLTNLPDKGESVRKFRDLLETEIKNREQIVDLEQSVTNLCLLTDAQKHVQKICKFEKKPQKDRYKPFATLNKTIEIKPERKVFKVMEDCKLENHPTKLLQLPESMDILKQQEERIKVCFFLVRVLFANISFQEGQLKIRYERIMEKLKHSNNEAESDTDDNNSNRSSVYDEDSE